MVAASSASTGFIVKGSSSMASTFNFPTMDLMMKHNCRPLYYCRIEDIACISCGSKSQHHLLSPISVSRSFTGRRRCLPITKIVASSNLEEDLKVERPSDSRKGPELDPKLKEASQLSHAESSSSSMQSPFVDGKISSHIAAKSAQADNSSLSTISAFSTPSPVSPPEQDSKPVSSPRITSSAGEKFQNAGSRISTDTKVQSTGPVSKSLLDAIKLGELDGKTTKFGQPLVPTDLFNEPKRVPPESKKFEFTFNRGQILIILSFSIIISIMLGTAFLVWKVGAIHFNEL